MFRQWFFDWLSLFFGSALAYIVKQAGPETHEGYVVIFLCALIAFFIALRKVKY